MSDLTTEIAMGDLTWSVLHATGEDAETFLQGQVSQDLGAVGDGVWSLLLAPDSIVLTTLWVTRTDVGFDLVTPRALGETAYTRLKRFLLRSKCELVLEETASGPITTVADQIERSWPDVHEFERGLTPHCFGRSFVDATVSFTKGCFTGQELVGRLDARGSSVPWRFVNVDGPDLSQIDTVLHSKGPDGPQGVTSAIETPDGWRGLGIAHRTLLGAPLEGENLRITEVD